MTARTRPRGNQPPCNAHTVDEQPHTRFSTLPEAHLARPPAARQPRRTERARTFAPSRGLQKKNMTVPSRSRPRHLRGQPHPPDRPRPPAAAHVHADQPQAVAKARWATPQAGSGAGMAANVTPTRVKSPRRQAAAIHRRDGVQVTRDTRVEQGDAGRATPAPEPLAPHKWCGQISVVRRVGG